MWVNDAEPDELAEDAASLRLKQKRIQVSGEKAGSGKGELKKGSRACSRERPYEFRYRS